MNASSYRTRLRAALTTQLSESELHNLCFDLGLDYENFAGQSKADKARELILYFERRRDVASLVMAVTSARPDIALDIPSPPAKSAPSHEPIPDYPSADFLRHFREVIAPVRYDGPETVLNIVFGNIADMRAADVVIPINQGFDFDDRGPGGVLQAFAPVMLGEHAFFDALTTLWPQDQRPAYAGIGHTQRIALPPNTQQLGAAYFVVTTRDMSHAQATRGRYVDTPIEGIDYILDRLLDSIEAHRSVCVAVPLLGTGYANVGRTRLAPQLKLPLRKAVLGLALQKFEDALTQSDGTLKRAVVVIYSAEPHSQVEHELWAFVIRFMKLGRVERTQAIGAQVAEFERLSE
jgi:hypothetical protein